MQTLTTNIDDVKLFAPTIFRDERGSFMETWHIKKLAEHGVNVQFVQQNHSISHKNVLRGLHYQSEQPQGKLVRVVAGSVFDVAVDLRLSSPTFGQWVSAELSADNHHLFWIPAGFAHGFYSLEDNSELIYSCTDYYNPTHEHTLRWDDSQVNIDWPFEKNQDIIISDKDNQGTTLQQAVLFA